jgi:1-acyl-sn-glycerol-3-phosphate acyltransferase
MPEATGDATPAVAVESAAAPAGLWSPSFIGLLIVIFLGAANDNIFRWLAIGMGKESVDPENIRHVLMIGSVAFVMPYLVFAAHAGYLADRFSKSQVIVWFKVAEIGIVALGVVGVLNNELITTFIVVALLGTQSALFGPARYGAIPEIVPAGKISSANGVIGLVSVIATVVGMGVGNLLSDDVTGKFAHGERWWPAAVVVITVAVLGWLGSMAIRRLPAANPLRKFPANPVAVVRQVFRDFAALTTSRGLFRVALGIMFFWSLGALAQLNIDQYAFEGGATLQSHVTWLLVALVVGVGVGCVLAGIWSGGHVELGILPLGAFGIMVSALLLFTVQGVLIDPKQHMTTQYLLACVFLFFLGGSAGLFSVPLESYIQHRSPPEKRGSILAASNFLTFGCMLVAFLGFTVLRMPFHAGAFENIPLPDIAADEQARLLAVAKNFQHELSAGKSPNMEEELAAAHTADERQFLLAHLMWDELAARRAAGKPVPYESYISRFPQEAGMVYNVYNQFVGLPLLSSAQIFLLCSILTVPVFVYIVCLIPQAAIRFVVWLMSKTFYRIRVLGLENLPERGGALLVPNHVSWLDGILLMLISSRPVRMVVFAGNFQNPIIKWMAGLHGTILMNPKPKSIAAALKTAREALNSGELVCIFPEGGITRTGQVQAFKPGMMKILQGTDAPVIPIYLDELWGSVFSFQGGRFFWKWPQRIPYPITIHIGPPVANPSDAHAVRQAVVQLGAHAVNERTKRMKVLPRQFIRQCKRSKFRSKVADSTGADMTGGSLLLRSLILRRLLRRHTLADLPDEKYVGVLLPPVAPAIVTNAALALDGRIAVNLNYTVSSEVMNYCIHQCGIKHVLTSRKFMEKLDYELEAEVVYLEDFKEKVTLGDKVSGIFSTFVLPAGLLERSLKLHEIRPSDTLTVIFTSGSTGMPKGVMLTHGNVGSNVEAINQVVHLTKEDTIVGILPLFHSFGYTVTMWSVFMLDIKGAYHFSPLEPKQIGKLAEKHKATILLSTPTFLRSYLRRVSPEEFASLNVVVCGAEKLPKDLVDAFEEKFKVRPVEGYGCTELSPLVSVNIPPSRSINNFQTDLKEGTVGRAVPGVSAKVVDLDTGRDLGVNEPGMLLVKGPNVMAGYLHQVEKTAEVVRDGWYTTGDVAMIDDEGFITITGRISRFSKIGGEMVPHITIEESLWRIVGAGEDEAPKLAVTAVPDERKGERLVVLHTAIDKTPDELCTALKSEGFPNLFVPGTDSFIQVDALPLLGTGKFDLRAIKQIAEQHFAPA